MARKKPSGPSQEGWERVLRMRERERKGGMPPEHVASIWSGSSVPDWRKPASESEITAAETRLGVSIPAALKKQYRIQNGGDLLVSSQDDAFEEAEGLFPFLGNAACDGLLEIEEWCLASEHEWFESVDDVDGLELLVVIAQHSEDQLCLDYRENGRRRVPGLTSFFVGLDPTGETKESESISKAITAMRAFKKEHSSRG